MEIFSFADADELSLDQLSLLSRNDVKKYVSDVVNDYYSKEITPVWVNYPIFVAKMRRLVFESLWGTLESNGGDNSFFCRELHIPFGSYYSELLEENKRSYFPHIFKDYYDRLVSKSVPYDIETCSSPKQELNEDTTILNCAKMVYGSTAEDLFTIGLPVTVHNLPRDDDFEKRLAEDVKDLSRLGNDNMKKKYMEALNSLAKGNNDDSSIRDLLEGIPEILDIDESGRKLTLKRPGKSDELAEKYNEILKLNRLTELKDLTIQKRENAEHMETLNEFLSTDMPPLETLDILKPSSDEEKINFAKNQVQHEAYNYIMSKVDSERLYDRFMDYLIQETDCRPCLEYYIVSCFEFYFQNMGDSQDPMMELLLVARESRHIHIDYFRDCVRAVLEIMKFEQFHADVRKLSEKFEDFVASGEDIEGLEDYDLINDENGNCVIESYKGKC